MAATIQQLCIDLSRLDEENRYLRDRLARIAPRERAHYTPVERFRILVLMRTHGWSVHDAAARFLVTSTTVGRWLQEAASAPARRTVGTLLRAAPPVRRYADVVRDLVRQMDRWGFGGNRRIAQTLARAGVRIGRETVRRYRKAPAAPPTVPAHAPVRASGPNHVWLMDLTTVPRWLGLRAWQVLGILDAWSRLPVHVAVSRAEPRAAQIADARRRAVATHGAPRALISDRGPVFRAATLRRTTRHLRIQHRFGAVGQTGSIALLERFWRTLKELIGTDRPALFVGDLERRLATALLYYGWLRPHAGLGGATPIERHLGLAPAHGDARPPARARPHTATPLPFTVAYLDRNPRCPVLLRQAA